MNFTWDEAKRIENMRKHGMDFWDAMAMFGGFAVVLLDNREEYGETRWVRIAAVLGRLLVVVYTEGDDESIRIISLRRAGPFERRAYDGAFRNRLGTS